MEQGIIEQFVNAIKQEPNDKKATYSAIVSRIDEEGVIWVYVAGADKDTPTAQTGVEVKKGDNVTVEWRNNKLYIAGNYSNPSAGVSRVQEAENAAKVANEAANNAVYDAGRARDAADSAQSSATEAKTIAEGVEDVAKDAQESANDAKQSADTAFRQLGFVEDIVGVLSLIAKHGEYAPAQEDVIVQNRWYFNKVGNSYEVVNNPTSVFHLTADTVIDVEKTYYERTGSGTEEAPYVYTAVETPVQADLPTYYEKYYVLVGIDEAIENYVASHMVLLNDGLWLQASDNEAKIQISTEQGNEGVIIYGSDNKALAHYGSTSVIGDKEGFHIEIDGQKIRFYSGPTTQAAYMSGSSLYVENNLSFGNFIFLERPNGHFTLKLID